MSQVESIIELQRILSEYEDLNAQLEGVPDWMKELHEEYTLKKARIDDIDQAALEAKAAHRKAESAILDAQAQLAHFQSQIPQVQSQRAYGALLQEIDTVKGQIKTLEDDAIDAMEASEVAAAEKAQALEAHAEIEKRYQGELAKWEEEKPSVATKVEGLRSTMGTLEASLPKNILAMFRRLLSHHEGNATAFIQRKETLSGKKIWHCSGCHYQVRLQMVGQIRNHGQILQCESCRKILVYENQE